MDAFGLGCPKGSALTGKQFQALQRQLGWGLGTWYVCVFEPGDPHNWCFRLVSCCFFRGFPLWFPSGFPLPVKSSQQGEPQILETLSSWLVSGFSEPLAKNALGAQTAGGSTPSQQPEADNDHIKRDKKKLGLLFSDSRAHEL